MIWYILGRANASFSDLLSQKIQGNECGVVYPDDKSEPVTFKGVEATCIRYVNGTGH